MPPRKKAPISEEIHYCRECAHVTPVMAFNTLTVHGQLPTLGRCHYWTQSRSVLLSERACDHYKKKI